MKKYDFGFHFWGALCDPYIESMRINVSAKKDFITVEIYV